MVAVPDGVPWSLEPSDPVHTVDAGALQARISQATSHIQLVGPDLAGAPSANTVVLAPPAVLTENGAQPFGKVVSATPIADGLALEQAVGGAQVSARLQFIHDGVLRYEVVDWAGLSPLQTAIAGPAAEAEHFFGFGERFDSLDQTGKRVDILTFDDPAPNRRSGASRPTTERAATERTRTSRRQPPTPMAAGASRCATATASSTTG